MELAVRLKNPVLHRALTDHRRESEEQEELRRICFFFVLCLIANLMCADSLAQRYLIDPLSQRQVSTLAAVVWLIGLFPILGYAYLALVRVEDDQLVSRTLLDAAEPKARVGRPMGRAYTR